MNRHTGNALDELGHLRQSIEDILTTPVGSRVMRRKYGSQLFELIDQPLNDHTRLRAYAATALALMRWEPRVRLTRVQLLAGAKPGTATLILEGTRSSSDETLNLQVPLKLGAAV
ncbi:GPW/gp25 family protein [Pseudomonas sp. TCU-HL1]|uniref:GPW/gp25 family protein n=1 Tax=Pseudomonas sp. TCU-HL1 TaxID=1856685 RepID=UPI00083D809A|nr:GPW/gp25 family protein [Pseudomonas sp. TCU-HL1]AOE85829.1 GPW/gp25 [Pseudomonas sp. TCU-HL1]